MSIVVQIKKQLAKTALFERDPFGNWLLIKRLLIALLGIATYQRFSLVNKLKIEGTEHLKSLPNQGVLFLSNHQTYFADVIAFYHIFCSVKWRFNNTINYPFYLLAPRAKNYYVAAQETMQEGGFIPRLFSYAGAVTVKRSWRAQGKNVQRGLDNNALDKIKLALDHGWVVSFPQGTTSPYAPIRKGSAHLVTSLTPIVVPVVINGFRRAFDKKGLFFKKRGVELSVKFKQPMRFSPDQDIDEVVAIIRELIEQNANPNEPQKASS